jgi:hypothetical protein
MPLGGEFSRRIGGLVSTNAARRLSNAPAASDARPLPGRLRHAVASIQIDRRATRATRATPHDRLTELGELGARRLGHATEDL